MAEDYQELIRRRAVVADQIVDVIETLGQLATEERALEERLRKLGEAAGVKANAFSTAVSITDAISSELTRCGLSPRRADPRLRVSSLIRDQHSRYRSQREVCAQVVGKSAA
jgi:hypothetical protein